MSAAFHGPPMHVPSHHLHPHHHHSFSAAGATTNSANSNNSSSHHHGSSTNNSNNTATTNSSSSGTILSDDRNVNGGPGGYMLDDGSGVVGGVGGYPHDGLTPPGMVWDPSLQGDGGGKFRLKRRRRCGQCAPCQVKENCNKCQYCMRKDVLKQACIYRKCVYLRKPVPRFRQDAPPPSNGASPPSNGIGGGPINKPPSTPPRKLSSNNNNNNNSSSNNNNINGVAGVTPAPSNCSSNSNGSSHNSGTASNGGNGGSNANHIGATSNGGSNPSSSTSGSSSTPLHHSALSAPSSAGATELSSCRLNQSPFGTNAPGTNGVVLDPFRHRSMMDAHYPHHHRAPGGPSFFDPMGTQLPSTASPHHHQHDLTPAAAAAAAVAAAAAGNSMSPHHPASHLNAHSQSAKMVSPTSTSTAAASRDAAAAATTYFPHPADSWGSAVPYAAFPRAPSWAASAYGFQQHSSPFASSFTPSSFPPSPFPGSSCRLSLPESGTSSSSASRYGPTAATSSQHPFHHTMTGISGFTAGDALSHAQYSHHAHHPHAHSNMRSSFYAPAPPTGHHLSSSSTLSGFPGLAPPSFGPSPYHPHPHSHMYPSSFYSSLRAATEPQIYHVRVLPSQNPFRLALEQTWKLLADLDNDKSEGNVSKSKLESPLSSISDKISSKMLLPDISSEDNDPVLSISDKGPFLLKLKCSTPESLSNQACLAQRYIKSNVWTDISLCSGEDLNRCEIKTVTHNKSKRPCEQEEGTRDSNIPFATEDKMSYDEKDDIHRLEDFEYCLGSSLLQEEKCCMRSIAEVMDTEEDADEISVSKTGEELAGPSSTVVLNGHKQNGCDACCDSSTVGEEGIAMATEDSGSEGREDLFTQTEPSRESDARSREYERRSGSGQILTPLTLQTSHYSQPSSQLSVISRQPFPSPSSSPVSALQPSDSIPVLLPFAISSSSAASSSPSSSSSCCSYISSSSAS